MRRDNSYNVGDLYSVQTSKGVGVFQCVSKTADKRDFDCIRLFEVVVENIGSCDFEQFTANTKFFYLLFPLPYWHKSPLVKKLGVNCGLQMAVKEPTIVRTLLQKPDGSHVWRILDMRRGKYSYKAKLTKRIQSYSPHGFWNPQAMVDWLEEGRTMENWGIEYFNAPQTKRFLWGREKK